MSLSDLFNFQLQKTTQTSFCFLMTSLTMRVLKTDKFHMLTKRRPRLQQAKKTQGSSEKYWKAWLFIQKMTRILMKKVRMFT